MTADACAAAPICTPSRAQKRSQASPNVLLIDVRDSNEMAATGTVAGATHIPQATLTHAADAEMPVEWRNPESADWSRPMITTCVLGPVGALGGKLLVDLGFTDVHILDGGVMAWKDAGLHISNRPWSTPRLLARTCDWPPEESKSPNPLPER